MIYTPNQQVELDKAIHEWMENYESTIIFNKKYLEDYRNLPRHIRESIFKYVNEFQTLSIRNAMLNMEDEIPIKGLGVLVKNKNREFLSKELGEHFSKNKYSQLSLEKQAELKDKAIKAKIERENRRKYLNSIRNNIISLKDD